MTSPNLACLTLSTLPEDVIHEILRHILTDIADPTRASVLRVCRTLHDAAGGLLYHDVLARSPDTWRQLFGDGGGGLLTVECGRNLAKHVRQLRLGRKLVTPFSEDSAACDFGTVVLPNLVHLLLDDTVLLSHPTAPSPPYDLRLLLSRLRPIHLTVMPSSPPGRSPFHRFDTHALLRTVADKLGLPSPAWPAVLRTLHFDCFLISERLNEFNSHIPWMSDWAIETVKVSSRKRVVKGRERFAAEDLENFFFDFRSGPARRSGKGAYAGWNKVEVRVDLKVEQAFGERCTLKLAQITAPEDKRLVSLIVFVDADGTERKFVES